MASIALIEFITQPEMREQLAEILERSQSSVVRAGCKHIALYEDEGNTRRLVEIEVWDHPDDHRAMVAKATAAGAFKTIEELLTQPMSTTYFALRKEKSS